MKLVAKTVGPGLWADTSETLNLSQYQYLALAGYRGCSRYVPLAGGHGGISLAELQAALSVKCPDGSPFMIDFVQFARTSGLNAQSGQADGVAAAEYVKSLGVPSTVSVWQDLAPGLKADCIAYSNASYTAMVQTYLAASAPGMYAEPGYPLSADERYNLLNLHRYWATAANDPNRFVSHRGVQGIQLWESNRGEFFPIPGLIIDADAAQMDYFGDFSVAVVAG